ncbi:calcium-independent phospholipase A2-gamma isoform X3 [Chelonia mydas]|uniref:calcium-independent phospholipase A2-gamma isoform X3 n=1 Tax=Chelonia mydas TaxID=8469 RepID=UPI0018A1BB11|nr:calcium-independent phospholipase A2-gamma isoform X3 [Chelonia mydas]
MSVNLPLNAYFYLLINTRSLWGKQRNKQLYYLCRPKLYWRISHGIPLRVFHTSKTQCKWTRSKTLNCSKHIYSHDFLYYRVSKHSTSSPKGLTKVNNRMSRIKNTFESVSKAVSGTHSELLARIARFKPNSGTLGKAFENNVQENNLQVNLENDKQTTCAGAQGDYNSLAVKNFVHTDENSESTLISRSCTNQDTLKDSVDIKNNLFHVSYFMTNFGETYNFLANHINWYFGNNTVMDQEKKGNAFLQDSKNELRNKLDSPESDIMSNENRMNSASALISAAEIQGADKTNTALPASTKKSIASFLSYPSNSVQAFVDSYVGSLVPKLRFETKAASEDKLQEREESLKDEEDGIKEIKTAEGKEKRLSLQREKIIARVSIDNRTRALVQALRRSSNRRVSINRIEELTYHLLEFPETRGVAIKEKIIPCLLQLRQGIDETLHAAVREALAIIGYTDPVKAWGIRILTIDGGGTRGLVALQTLHKLEELTGKPVHELFDYVCGVSTGAILAFMLGLFHIPLDECEELYHKLGSDVFKQNVIVGTMKMGWSHAFYDSDIWEKMLKDRMGSDLMIETARNPKCPKDGGLLLNNPTALAVHECKCLWPNVPLQCVISLGTGRYESERKNSITYTSLKTKLTNVISSATDTEEVHTMLDGLLPPDTYFRFNPLMNEDIPLDENRKEKLNQLRTDGIRYLERNEEKIKKAARILTQEKTVLQRFNEWIRLKAYMCEGLPFLSKL